MTTSTQRKSRRPYSQQQIMDAVWLLKTGRPHRALHVLLCLLDCLDGKRSDAAPDAETKLRVAQ
jgi:hypothetical protein